MNEGTKYPKLLPRYEHFTNLLICEVHQRLIHAGVAHMLSQIREEYWIPQGRVQVKSVISKCLICRNMPPWPQERVSKCDPFLTSSLD